MQRQVLQSCSDPVLDAKVLLQLQLQFIDRVFFPRCEQRQVPQLFQFLDKVALCSGCGALQRQGRRCASGHAVALWRLVEEFHIFSACSRCSHGFVRKSHEFSVSGSHLPLCVATVHGDFWTSLYLAVTACVSLLRLLKEFQLFST